MSQTGRSYKTHYTEHIKALTQPLMKSNFAEHIFNTHLTYTNNETNLEILHILWKDPKINTAEQYVIYKHYKQSPTNIVNDQIHYKPHTLWHNYTNYTCQPRKHLCFPNPITHEKKPHHSQIHWHCQAFKMEHMAPRSFWQKNSDK